MSASEIEQTDAEIQAAAAQGAAAATAAVQDDQRHEEIVSDAAETADHATGAAETAAEHATIAANASGEAIETATDASTRAAAAEATAAEAHETAWTVRDELAAMREEHRQALAGIHGMLSKMQPVESDQPTEVVVTHGPDTSEEQSNGGSAGSARTESGTSAERSRRHRFGH